MNLMKNWKKKRDQKTSKAIAQRDDYTCVWCGHSGDAHAHIISRRFLKTRWLLENGLWMCTKCHYLFDNSAAHRNHIIKHIVTFWVYDKLVEIRDGKTTAKECGFTEID